MEKIDRVDNHRWRLLWLLGFALNLCIPLFVGWGVTERGGRFGMITAIGLLGLIGHMGCGRSRTLAFLLVVGGFVVALTQFFPMVQIVSGTIGLTVAQALGQAPHVFEWSPPNVSPMTELGGFVATLVTGCLLVIIALLIGGILYGSLAWIRLDPLPAKSITHDPEVDGAAQYR